MLYEKGHRERWYFFLMYPWGTCTVAYLEENMGRLLAHCNRELPRLVGYLSFSSSDMEVKGLSRPASLKSRYSPRSWSITTCVAVWSILSFSDCFKTSMVAREKGVYGHVAVDLEIPPKELHPRSAVLKVVCVWFASLRHAGF